MIPWNATLFICCLLLGMLFVMLVLFFILYLCLQKRGSGEETKDYSSITSCKYRMVTLEQLKLSVIVLIAFLIKFDVLGFCIVPVPIVTGNGMLDCFLRLYTNDPYLFYSLLRVLKNGTIFSGFLKLVEEKLYWYMFVFIFQTYNLMDNTMP